MSGAGVSGAAGRARLRRRLAAGPGAAAAGGLAALFRAGADRAARRRGPGVQRLAAQPAPGGRADVPDAELDELVRDGAALVRPVLAGGVPAAVAVAGADPRRVPAGRRRAAARRRTRPGTGAVVALPHAGNWDAAGAWVARQRLAAHHGRRAAQAGGRLPAVPRLPGEPRHGDHPADRRRPAAAGRAGRAAAGRRTSCRCWPTGTCPPAGVEVDFFGGRTRMPAGPALLALRTGAPLYVVDLWYEPDAAARPRGRPAAGAGPTAGRWTCGCGCSPSRSPTGWRAGIAQHPADWHMLQRLWLDRRRRPTTGAAPSAAGGLSEGLTMRIGIVCPYSFDVPGGVQNHVTRPRRDADRAGARGQRARARPTRTRRCRRTWCRPGGRCRCRTTARWPGSSFGPVSAARVRRWLHRRRLRRAARARAAHAEPVAAGGARPPRGPVVATFHTAMTRSRALRRRAGRAAAGAGADHRPDRGQRAGPQGAGRAPRRRRGGDPQRGGGGPVRRRRAAAGLAGRVRPARRHVGFLGRFTEPRKGFACCCDAFAALAGSGPACGCWSPARATRTRRWTTCRPTCASGSRSSGMVSEEDKARMLRSVDVYVAPNTGGESFGMILTEAMAAGTPVVASDLDAFRRVLDGGRAGALFPTGDAAALARRARPSCSTTRPRGPRWPHARRPGGRARTTGRWSPRGCWRSTPAAIEATDGDDGRRSRADPRESVTAEPCRRRASRTTMPGMWLGGRRRGRGGRWSRRTSPGPRPGRPAARRGRRRRPGRSTPTWCAARRPPRCWPSERTAAPSCTRRPGPRWTPRRTSGRRPRTT